MNARSKSNWTILILFFLSIIATSWNNTGSDRFAPALKPPGAEQAKWRVPVIFNNMKILYAGIDNPVTIFFPESSGPATVSLEDGTSGSGPTHGEERFYLLKPLNVGPQDLTIKADGKSYRITVSVLRLPDPALTVGTLRPGKIEAAAFKQQKGIVATLTDTRFHETYKVLSYTVGANGGTVGTYKEAINEGADWKGAAAQIINKTGPGTSVFFNSIMVEGPDGKKRNLGSIAFQQL